MQAGSSASWTSSCALALLLPFAIGCGRHDTPLASYRPPIPDSGEAGMSSGGAAGAAPGPACLRSYPTVVDGLTSRYKEVRIGQPWVAAELDCEAEGGHLIVIDDEAENTWASTVAATAITNDESTHELAWLGLGDSASEGVFTWVTGAAPSLALWSSGEPNTMFGDEDCVEVRASAEWNDDRCDAPLIYICECDGAASAGTWCDSNTALSCGDCTTACAADQTCVKQQCI
jgi:hypothetical protein